MDRQLEISHSGLPQNIGRYTHSETSGQRRFVFRVTHRLLKRWAVALVILGGLASMAPKPVHAGTSIQNTTVEVAQAPPTQLPAARIAAAASLRFVMGDLTTAFEAKTGLQVKTSFGASGILMRQILAGAPFELFLAADETFTQPLEQAGRTRQPATVYAFGRLALLTHKDKGPAWTIEQLREGLLKTPPARLAIANPETAPYGKAARHALEQLGLWARAQPRLVIGENVSQAAQFALTGNADGGLVALSLALAPPVAGKSVWTALPTHTHPPVRHTMALLRKAGVAAHAFHGFMVSPDAQEILGRFGFLLTRTSE